MLECYGKKRTLTFVSDLIADLLSEYIMRFSEKLPPFSKNCADYKMTTALKNATSVRQSVGNTGIRSLVYNTPPSDHYLINHIEILNMRQNHRDSYDDSYVGYCELFIGHSHQHSTSRQ